MDSNSPVFVPSPSPSKYHSTFCFYVFDYIMYLLWVDSCSICPPVTGLAWWLPGPSTWSHQERFPSFYGWIIFFVCIDHIFSEATAERWGRSGTRKQSREGEWVQDMWWPDLKGLHGRMGISEEWKEVTKGKKVWLPHLLPYWPWFWPPSRL